MYTRTSFHSIKALACNPSLFFFFIFLVAVVLAVYSTIFMVSQRVYTRMWHIGSHAILAAHSIQLTRIHHRPSAIYIRLYNNKRFFFSSFSRKNIFSDIFFGTELKIFSGFLYRAIMVGKELYIYCVYIRS